MAFVPRGHLPVKSAIRRMAQAWQVSLRSARAKMQAILHSRSMRAYALEQSTGRMLEITSESWATDHALRWLKSGTCLLPNEDGKVRITTERFDMFYRAENAPIFIVEDDLHRCWATMRQQDPNSQKQSSHPRCPENRSSPAPWRYCRSRPGQQSRSRWSQRPGWPGHARNIRNSGMSDRVPTSAACSA
jgi:hypothetical protein